MKVSDVRNQRNEGWYNVRPINRDRYGEREGLEGPFQTKAGKVVYYDPREGAYYDPDTDMYLTYDEWNALNEGLPPHLAKFIDKDGDWTADAKKRLGKDGVDRLSKTKKKSKDVTPKGYGPDEIEEGWHDDKGSYTSTGTTTYLLKNPEGNEWNLLNYEDTPGSNPQHLRKMIEQRVKRLGWQRGDVVAQWKGDIDDTLDDAQSKLASGKQYIHSYKMELEKKVRDLTKAKEVMAAGEEVQPANTEARDPREVIGNFLKQKEQRSARGKKLYTDREFQQDLAAVKAGKADPSAMADKWGERGGAFLNFVREGEPTDSDYAIGMAQAKKATGDKKPLKKSTIKKAHKIARAVAKESEDDPCWKGYRQLGMKKKNGKEVPNCVPEAKEEPRPTRTDRKKVVRSAERLAQDLEKKDNDKVDEVNVDEGIFRKKEKISPPEKFPSGKIDLESWIDQKVAYYKAKGYSPADLFDPSSGDYIPADIHTGSQFDNRALRAYRAAKEKYPELVKQAQKQKRLDLVKSRVGDPQDFNESSSKLTTETDDPRLARVKKTMPKHLKSRQKKVDEAMPNFGNQVTVKRGGKVLKQFKVDPNMKMHHLARELRHAKLGLSDLELTNAARDLARGKGYKGNGVEIDISVSSFKPRQYENDSQLDELSRDKLTKYKQAASDQGGTFRRPRKGSIARLNRDGDMHKEVQRRDSFRLAQQKIDDIDYQEEKDRFAAYMKNKNKGRRKTDAVTEKEGEGYQNWPGEKKKKFYQAPKDKDGKTDTQKWAERRRAEREAKKEAVSYERGMDTDATIIVKGVKGMNSKPFRKKFRNQAAFDRWMDSDAAGDYEVHQVTNEQAVAEKEGGMSDAERKAYNRKHGSNLKRAQPSGGKRRTSYCSRSKGQMDQHNIDCRKDPDKPICKARRDWNC